MKMRTMCMIGLCSAALQAAAVESGVTDDLRQRAQAGDVAAEVALGQRLMDEKQPAATEEAKRWFRKAAEQGNAQGAWMLGSAEVASAPSPSAEGIAWMQKSVALDHDADHMATLAFVEFLAGRKADALEWARRAADAGSVKAMQMLAMSYSGAFGYPKDLAAARHWMTLAASKGDPASELMLGQFYLSGLLGTTDVPAGLQWMQRAAAAGSAQAVGTLATLYLTGEMHVPRDPARALPLARQAAAANDMLGHYALGIAYQQGAAVGADPRQAWYHLALASRMDEKHNLHDVADRMSRAATQLSAGELEELAAKVDAVLKAAPPAAPAA